MKKKLVGLSGMISGSVATLALPFIALAQGGKCTGVPVGTIEYMICKIGDLLSMVLPIVLVLGVLYFVWGVVQYVISDDEAAKAKGRDRMIFGIIGLVVIVSMWGLVSLVISTFGVGNSGAYETPPVIY